VVNKRQVLDLVNNFIYQTNISQFEICGPRIYLAIPHTQGYIAWHTRLDHSINAGAKWPCTILHLGRNNTLHNYSVNNVSLPDVTVVTDLGVLVGNNLRFAKHYCSIINMANHRSSFIWSHFNLEIRSCFRAFTVLCAPCWTIVVLYGRLFIKRVSILLNVYNVAKRH